MMTDNIIKKVIDVIIRKKVSNGEITSPLEKEAEEKKIRDTLQLANVSLKPNIQKGKTDVTKYNDDIAAIELDMYVAYEKMNDILETLDAHKKLNSSLINTMRTSMSSLNDDIKALADVLSKFDNNIVYTESFRNGSNFEIDDAYYTNESGIQIGSAYKAEFDKINECVKMPKLFTINKMIASNGQRMANININKQLGGGLINLRNPSNDISKAIDTSLDTYWEETILADTPIKIKLDDIKYYGHYFGALCELEIVFDSAVEINEIELHPFGSYPIDIMAIRYYTTDDTEKEEEEIINKDKSLDSIEIVGKNADIKSFLCTDAISLQFHSIVAKRLKIIINQRHYIRNAFIYDKKDASKNEVWFKTSEDTVCLLDTNQKGVYELKTKTDPTWVCFSEITRPLYEKRNIDIEEFLFSSPQITKAIKYEYTYGFYHIGVNENSYKDTAIYVSKPIKLDQNIGSLKLDTVETIPDNNHTISYYVSFVNSPKVQNWIQMHPNTSINLLELMESNKLETVIEAERFFGSRGRAITLEHSPYINAGDKANSYIEITLIKDGEIIREGAGIENVTNYNNPASSYKRLNKNSDIIQYYFYKNKLHFNKVIPKDVIINVSYKHFIDSVRVKAILRRSMDGDSSLSTALNEFTLTLKPIW